MDIFTLDEGKTFRISSWDRTGGNRDWVTLNSKESKILAEIEGPACIRRFYCLMINPHPLFYRLLVLRAYWDDEKNPSIEVPLGDFFCIGNCTVRLVNSSMISVFPGNDDWYTYGLSCYFAMPFEKNARIEIEYQACDIKETDRHDWKVTNICEEPIRFWYQIDIEKNNKFGESSAGKFHAQWRRDCPTTITGAALNYANTEIWDGTNLSGEDNYVILEAEGKGKVVGILLNVDNYHSGKWWGEGDDMVFIDDDTWPPSIHGTGTEEIWGGGASPNQEYSGLFSGIHLVENSNCAGKTSMYRWFINDPMKFQKRIKVTIEHGHANNFANDYSSVAYWYQTEPHLLFPSLLPPNRRLPFMHRWLSRRRLKDMDFPR